MIKLMLILFVIAITTIVLIYLGYRKSKITGIIVSGILAIIIGVILTGVIPSRVWNNTQEAEIGMCVNNLKALGLVLQIYMDTDSENISWPSNITEEIKRFGDIKKCPLAEFDYVYFRPEKKDVLPSTPIVVCTNHLDKGILIVLYANADVKKIEVSEQPK